MVDEYGWQTMATALKDGTILELMHFNSVMPCVYIAWWDASNEDEGCCWVLNDDEHDPMIEADYDLSIWFWRRLQLPEGKKLEESSMT